MPQRCTVCDHADRAAIDRAIVAGESAPRIGTRHGVSADSVLRHRRGHLPELLARAALQGTARALAPADQAADWQAQEQVAAVALMGESAQLFSFWE
jgi:hypothetical protein